MSRFGIRRNDLGGRRRKGRREAIQGTAAEARLVSPGLGQTLRSYLVGSLPMRLGARREAPFGLSQNDV